MTKKTAYQAYYYLIVNEMTQTQLKSSIELPSIDVSSMKERMEERGIAGTLSTERDYPWRLQTAPSAPYVFYHQGSLDVLNKPTLAIVGPRNMSSFAHELLEKLFEILARYDLVTVSGMAPGVDTVCHELSLRYGIPTIAVLGGGFGYFLRSEKRTLMKQIIEGGGLIISEYKHEFKPTPRSFPQRNRLIASLADTIFLPEAREKSGSLITAEMGYKLHKPVYAPMNSIVCESSKGTNQGIVAGTILPLADLESFLAQHYTCKVEESVRGEIKNNIMDELTEEERFIVTCMKEVKDISLLLLGEKTGYDSATLLIHLTMLEMKGLIIETSPHLYKIYNM